MPLEDFFKQGNYIAFFGSQVYAPEQAKDLDFTIFTRGASNHLNFVTRYTPEIVDFAEAQLGLKEPTLDFTGRDHGKTNTTYDLKKLPTRDSWLDGIYLTGLFFPNRSFLDVHYLTSFGARRLKEPWLRFADDISLWSLQEHRFDKEQKTIPLLLRATETISTRYENLKPIILKYRIEYNFLMKKYSNKRIKPFN